ncbi:MAG TPA: hypothetical protein VEY93_14185 [Longimicrobium sp.]|nr:hypothetical protein [Longimicrobium sp.]
MQRSRIFLFLPAVMLLGTASCDRLLPTALAPKPSHIRLAQPEVNFRLSSEDRAKVIPGFDVDALERLLAAVTPEMRREVLAFFQRRSPDGEPRGQLYGILDPELQAILEEVWAPMWNTATDEQIAENAFGMPGRKIAEERRKAVRARGGADPE